MKKEKNNGTLSYSRIKECSNNTITSTVHHFTKVKIIKMPKLDSSLSKISIKITFNNQKIKNSKDKLKKYIEINKLKDSKEDHKQKTRM
jgi:pyruvate/2-oxoglutarate dehydrogenase complex dihydrolipoamide acyltransferase (E2) component